LSIMNGHTRKLLHLLLFALIPAIGEPLHSYGQQKIPKIGLVLSGGGARAACEIGVLKVFERERIPIDYIAATSFGSLVGGLYAIGYSAAEIERLTTNQDWGSIFTSAPRRRFTPLIERRNARYQGQISFKGWNPELPTGFWGGQRLTETLDLLTSRRMLPSSYDFDKLPIPFRAVATNLVDGKRYVFRQGSMTDALRASMAVPLIFTPFEKDGMLLVDGGLVDNMPTDVVRDMGADVIIAVDSTSPLLTRDKIRSFLDVTDQSISLQTVRNVQESRKLASIVLQPDLEKFTSNDFDMVPEIVKRGEEEAEKQLERVKALVAGIPFCPNQAPSESVPAVIDSISFRGLKKIKPAQLQANIRAHPGEKVDPSVIGADVGRLYATRLFDSVEYNLEPLGEDRYRLVFVVKEAPLGTLGAGLRYDNDYNFVALAEFTVRQLFHSPSTATISSQFGGLQDHYAALRFISPSAQFLFIEPKVEVSRFERLDIRNQELADKFTDRREGIRLMIGGSIARQLEVEAGYRAERVRILGGSLPNRLAGSVILAGPSFSLHRDTLDHQEFPRGGMILKFQVDKPGKSFGGDLDYSKWQTGYQRYLPVSRKSTLQINLDAGYSRGPVPFYDLFFVGGYSLSGLASRQFLGLEHDEFPANQMAIVGASYRRQIFFHPLGIVRQGFITGTYNGLFYSNRQSSPYQFDYLNGAGIGLAFDTMLGPVRTAVGWSEGGRSNFYISFGPAF
jgi:NTE family protein